MSSSYMAETSVKYRVGGLLVSVSEDGVGFVALEPHKSCNCMGMLFAKWVFVG